MSELQKLEAATKTLYFAYLSYEERAEIWERIAELKRAG